ncbi:MAG: hypothetical protein H6739_04025 [Alphaproteobacteria bacterium]|nr:hypothetical protein [Alphaproteobacteria bacterium]
MAVPSALSALVAIGFGAALGLLLALAGRGQRAATDPAALVGVVVLTAALVGAAGSLTVPEALPGQPPEGWILAAPGPAIALLVLGLAGLRRDR